MANQRAAVCMSESEVAAFLQLPHTMSCATMGPDGDVHLVAMWYGFVEGRVAMVTKAKSQKARNLGRQPRMTCLVEDGDRYDSLRGVQLVCRVGVVNDLDRVLAIGRSVRSRYRGSSADSSRVALAQSMRNRVGLVLSVERCASWDHSKILRKGS